MSASTKPVRPALRPTTSAPRIAPPRPRGRPRVTPEQVRQRLATYCRRYEARVGDNGLPPFPAGQRESPQHREWMALYKAHRRLQDRPEADDVQRLPEFMAAQRASCAICGKRLDVAQARLDRIRQTVLHLDCLRLVTLGRLLGADAVERVKEML